MHIFNDKVITLVCGSPGSGKSTFAAKLVKLAGKAGVPVWCNYPVLGALRYEVKDLCKYGMHDSVLIVDEAGLSFNCRNIKAFTNEHYHWFATARHRHVQIFLIVQSWKRLDTILRELASETIMFQRGLFQFSTYKVYHEKLALIENREGYATEFDDVFAKVKWGCFWRPNYYHMFDSYFEDKEYQVHEKVLYPKDVFPAKLPLWRRLFGLKGKPSPPAAGLPAPGGGG